MTRPLMSTTGTFLLAFCASCASGDGAPSAADDLFVEDAAMASRDDAAMPRTPADAPAATSCDLLAQDCALHSDKCTIVETLGPRAATCSAQRGGAGENETCTRGAGGFGDDDCAPGLFCSFIGELGPAQGGVRRCHPLCTQDGDCPHEQRCGILIDGPRQGGFCGPSCDPFSACGDRLTCGDLYTGAGGPGDLWLACRPIGSFLSGDPCDNAYQCPADHVCGDNGTCQALCDANHPCALGRCRMMGKAGVCL